MEQKKISASSILFALLFYTISVWANANKALNAGALFLLMAIIFGSTAVLYVLTSKTIVLVVSTVVMIFVGVYFITPIAADAIQEVINIIIAALIEAIEDTGWSAIPVIP